MSLGLPIGLLCDGILLINSSGWLVAFIFPVVLPPLIGLLIGLIVGWKGFTPAAPWYVTLLFAILVGPALLWGPIRLKEWEFRHFVGTLPAYHNAERRIQNIGVLGGDDPPRVRVAFEAKDGTIPQMVKFYGDYFVGDHWIPEQPQEEYTRDVWYNFRKGNYDISIIGYEGGQWGGMQCVAIIRRHNTMFYR